MLIIQQVFNKCDPRDSQQLTYAIKVTEEEYYNAKAFVEEYARQEEIKYKTSKLRREQKE